MITRDQIRRERLVAAILHESRSILINEGRGRTIIEAEEMRDFNRMSAGVRRLAFIAAVGTENTTIEIEEHEHAARQEIFANEEPRGFETISDRVDDSLKEAYARMEDRFIAYKTLKDIMLSEHDLLLCDIYNDQFYEHHQIYQEMNQNLKRCLMVGQWRIERREECDLRWEREEKEQEEFDAITEEIRSMISTQNFSKLKKYQPIFDKYKMLDDEEKDRKHILRDEEEFHQEELIPSFESIREDWKTELEKAKLRIRRLSSVGSARSFMATENINNNNNNDDDASDFIIINKQKNDDENADLNDDVDKHLKNIPLGSSVSFAAAIEDEDDDDQRKQKKYQQQQREQHQKPVAATMMTGSLLSGNRINNEAKISDDDDESSSLPSDDEDETSSNIYKLVTSSNSIAAKKKFERGGYSLSNEKGTLLELKKRIETAWESLDD